MRKRAGEDLPASIDHVRIQFEMWRAQKGKRERIPDRLWQLASEAARRHSVHAVSHAVGLEHVALKRRVEEAPAVRGKESPSFIEVAGMEVADHVGCIVDLQKGNGTRMRICVRDGASVDWLRMKEAFLGA